MTKLILLGVGNGATLNLYNTCFVIQTNKENFLIDTGGSIEIINRLKKVNIDFQNIKHIFISHTHTDHILGLIWMIKLLYKPIIKKELTDKINIYCNDEVYEGIETLIKTLLPEELIDIVYDWLEFKVLKDKDRYTINGIEYEFFDIKARGNKQYGFEFKDNGKRFVFLGDQTINPDLFPRVKDADYVTHEVFCLEQERKKFLIKASGHSTVKDTSETMNKLNVKNLILYHTGEAQGKDRKRIYTEEGKEYFKGNIIVPDEFEEIEI